MDCGSLQGNPYLFSKTETKVLGRPDSYEGSDIKAAVDNDINKRP